MPILILHSIPIYTLLVGEANSTRPEYGHVRYQVLSETEQGEQKHNLCPKHNMVILIDSQTAVRALNSVTTYSTLVGLCTDTLDSLADVLKVAEKSHQYGGECVIFC